MTENDANPFTQALEQFDSDFSPFEQASGARRARRSFRQSPR